jgi:hypothetical protein
MFNADEDNETLPPGVQSREAIARSHEVTGTQVGAQSLAREASTREQFLEAVQQPGKGGLRTKWTSSQVKCMATDEAWSYGWKHGRIDVGTVAAVGNLLLQGMSVVAVRKALGITPNTWRTWIERGTGDDAGTQQAVTAQYADDAVADAVAVPLPQSPYSVLVFVVDNSQAIMELRAVKGWTSHFDRDWKAAQAFLVARNPDEWNPTTKTTVDSTSKVDVSIQQPYSTSELLEVAAILQRQGAIPSKTTAQVIAGSQADPHEGSTQPTPTTPEGSTQDAESERVTPKLLHMHVQGTETCADEEDPSIQDAEIIGDSPED